MTKQTLNVIVNGKTYQVEVEDLQASPLKMRVNGNPYEVEIEGGQPVVQKTTAPEPAAPAVKPTQPAQTPATAAPPKTTSVGSSSELRAPMPGVILDIAVKAGDSVTKGQQLCALEAMKMKSAIRATYAGVIASVEVQEGQKVNHNDILFRFA